MVESTASTVQLRSRGVLTLPKTLRDKYDLDEGDSLHLVDVGGTFVLTPMEPVVPALARELERLRETADLTTSELLQHLRDERETLVRERYGTPPATADQGDDGPSDVESPEVSE